MASSSSNQFGLSLLGRVAKDGDGGNLFLSPFSISVALAMTELGSRGETAAAMKRALCWNADEDAIHTGFHQYLETLQKSDDSCTLKTANQIYIEEGYPILADFLNRTKTLYFAEPMAAKFSQQPEEERLNINRWVEDVTEKKIMDLIKPNILNTLTRMVLVNAIYFKGNWKDKFAVKDTMPRNFHISPSQVKSVPMMWLKRNFAYHKADDFAVLELPYEGDKLCMDIFLPDDNFGLENLREKLTLDLIKKSISKLQSNEKVDVTLPKFEISSSFTLKNVLSKLGMEIAFNASLADFGGMTSGNELFLAEVVHQAFLKVDEEGSEAAAATAAFMQFRCLPPPCPEFLADHPFMVFIRDKRNDVILFTGLVMDPSTS